MAGKRGRKRAENLKAVKEDIEEKVAVDESADVKPSVGLVPSVSDSELARNQLRERWELASVLNFVRVFKPVIHSKLEISAGEIETALIRPNNDLTELHIALLKGIPPVSKNLNNPDAWVTVLYKKLSSWWRWVAEGEIPIKAAPGEESSRYKELDPVNRLLILKALCEIRAFQDDAVSYINGALKQGTEICTFRQGRIGGDGIGIGFWNDGDSVTGYRLYREVMKVEFTPRKGKGRLTQPPNSCQWETLATNLEEFHQISDKFSSTGAVEEDAVAEVLKNEIIPILEEIEKKKERALKRQQKQVMILNGYLNSYPLEGTRSCRNRKPVNYTFDDYDRSIDEAIQENKKRKTSQEPKHGKKGIECEGGKDGNSNGNPSNNGFTEHNTDDDDDEDDNLKGVAGDSDSRGDKDYEDKSDNDDNDEEYNDDNEENTANGSGTRARGHSRGKNGHTIRDVTGLRRSNRIPGNSQKRNSHSDESDSATVSNSDDGSSSEGSAEKACDDASSSKSSSDDGSSTKSSADKTSSAGKESLDVLEGLLEESEEDDGEGEKIEESEEDDSDE